MRRLVAVDREAHAHEPCGLGLRDDLGRQPAPAGRRRAHHPARPDRPDDVEPVVAQVRLAADEGNLLDAQIGHLVHEIERLGGCELVGSSTPGARAAVAAGEVARERDLPDRVDRPMAAIDLARLRREGQPAGSRRRVGRDGKPPPGAGAGQLRGARFAGERIGLVHPRPAMKQDPCHASKGAKGTRER